MTTTYVHTQTEYEIEACKRDAAKRAQARCHGHRNNRLEAEIAAHRQ